MAAPDSQLPAVAEGHELRAAPVLASASSIAREQQEQEQQQQQGAAENKPHRGWRYRFNNPKQVGCLYFWARQPLS